jgi:large subunit ribosomal protein L3
VPKGTFFIVKMLNQIFAKKTHMTSRFNTAGEWKGVTVLDVLPMKVVGSRTVEKNGYKAMVVELKDKKAKIKNKEIRTDDVVEVGTEVKFEEIIKAGDMVTISGTSKGKGCAGPIKRWNFKSGPRTHGQSDRERSPGSSGSTTTPGRVYKGKRRAGHMGREKVTMKNVKVMEVDAENKKIILQGGVPGARNFELLTIKK